MTKANLQTENGKISLEKKIIHSNYSYFDFKKDFKNEFNIIYGVEENGKYCLNDIIKIFNGDFRFLLKFADGIIDSVFLLSTKKFSSEEYLDLKEANAELNYLENILNHALKSHPQRNHNGCTWTYRWGAISTKYQIQDASVFIQINWT